MEQRPKTLLLKESEVADLIDLPGAVECMRRAYEDQARGEIVPWPPSLMRSDRALLILRSGGLPGQHRYGVRVTTGPQNPSYALVYGSPEGRLLSVVNYPFSDLRLDATVSLAVSHLAPPTVRRMALIGSGRLAMGLLEGICLARDVDEIQVYSRTAANRERFADEAATHLSRRVAAAPSVRQAADGAELVLVATSSNDPVLAASDLPENVLVVSIGPRSELYEDVFRQASRIIVTSRVQELDVPDAGDHLPLVRLINSGVLRRDDLVELGDVVTGKLTSPPGLVLFREAQGGFSDIALAAHAYERAHELGRGTEVDLS